MSEERSVFWTSFFQQKKTLEKLIEESHTDKNFYLLVTVSAVITTLGLLIDNAVVVIGGMLVAPLLFPILSLAMGITTSNPESINRSAKNIAKASGVVLLVSLITTFLLGDDELSHDLLDKVDPNLAFFLIAFAAGVAAAYTWVKENMSASLPGVAVSVALIPPLSSVGIGIVLRNVDLISKSITLFLINLVGIAGAALLVFSLFGFANMRQEEKKLIEKEAEDDIEETKGKLEKIKEQEEDKLRKVEKKLEQTEEKISEVKES